MAMPMLRWCPISATQKFSLLQSHLLFFKSTPPFSFSSKLRSISTQASTSAHSVARNDVQLPPSESSTSHDDSPFSGLDEMMTGFIFGKRKATEVAHAVWKNVVRKGDVVVDATCGNGYDTLAMARLIADDARRGCVLAMDVQKSALENTSSLLDRSLSADEVCSAVFGKNKDRKSKQNEKTKENLTIFVAKSPRQNMKKDEGLLLPLKLAIFFNVSENVGSL